MRGEVLVLFKLWWWPWLCCEDVSESERMLLRTELTLSKSIVSSSKLLLSAAREIILEVDTMGLSSLADTLGIVLTDAAGTGWGRRSSSKHDVSTFFVILANNFEEVLRRVGVCEEDK